MLYFIVLFTLYPHQSICVANLKYFETLSHVGVTSIIKRSGDGTENLMKYVRFRAFDRNFGLTLKSGTHLMAEGFTARLVDGNGRSTYFDFDQSTIFSGHLKDKPNVRVHAHIEDTLWTIQIYDQDDIYAVEPAWRLLTQTENLKNDTMIAYRASDLSSDSFNSFTFCGVKDHVVRGTPYQGFVTRTARTRVRKVPYNESEASDGTRNHFELDSACLLLLFGDYTFFKGKCNGNKAVCTALMFSYIRRVDEIYKTSVFEDTQHITYTGVGIEVGEIVLFSTYSKDNPQYKYRHFNVNLAWNISFKLDLFAYYVNDIAFKEKYCAYHLFTDYPFPGRILGYAWPQTLCQKPYYGARLKSTGLSSGTDVIIGPISTLQMNLVFAHGHNFGARHDPETAQCYRSENHGGPFLMWHKSVSGKFDNNYKFSPCSLRSIGNALQSYTCLTPRELITSYCGNGAVDNNEECDAGALGVIDTDPCCTNKCKLRNLSDCSDMNLACCSNCKTSPEHMLCRGVEYTQCREASYCTGFSQTCPVSRLMVDWTPCTNHGFCYYGICRDFCQVKSIQNGRNLKGCLCQTNDNGEACKWCCFDDSKPGHPGPCEVHSNETLMDGSHCYMGYCKAGICENIPVKSTYQRIFIYLPRINISELGQFMKSNIVLAVIVLSLFFWLPPIYLINQADKREKQAYDEQQRHLSISNSCVDSYTSLKYQDENKSQESIHEKRITKQDGIAFLPTFTTKNKQDKQQIYNLLSSKRKEERHNDDIVILESDVDSSLEGIKMTKSDNSKMHEQTSKQKKFLKMFVALKDTNKMSTLVIKKDDNN